MYHILNVTSEVVIAKNGGEGFPVFVGNDESVAAFLEKTGQLGIVLSSNHFYRGGVMPLNESDIRQLKECPLFKVTECETLAAAKVMFASLDEPASTRKM